MTNQALLKELCTIENEISQGNYIEVSNIIRKMIKDVKNSIISDDAKKNGKGKQLSALKRICKTANREEMKEPFEGNGFQWFCSSYHFVGIPWDHRIPWQYENENKFNLDCMRFIPKTSDPLPLPDPSKLSAYIKIKKAEGEKYIKYCFGDRLIVDAKLLLDILEAMPGCEAERVSGSNTAIIKFKSGEMVGGLCPVRLGKYDDAEKYLIPTKL